MAQIVTNIIQNSLSGMVAGAVTTVGEYAGEAVNGVGNLIEAKGNALGDGIANKIEGWSTGFTNYGNAVKSATAPNANYTTTKKVAVKKVSAIQTNKKITSSTSKAAPKKALASIPERKLLTQGPTNGGAPKGTYDKAVAPYKGKASTIAPSVGTIATKKTTAVKAGQPKPFIKSSTNAAGKVIPQKQSKPGYVKPPPVAKSTANYKGPLALSGVVAPEKNGAKIETAKPAGAYQGPLNIGGSANVAKPNAGSVKKPTQAVERKVGPSVKGSVVGTGPKSLAGSYGGPLKLGGLA